MLPTSPGVWRIVSVQYLVKSVETAKHALDILAETLDPPSDQYSAIQFLSRTSLQKGERIEDFVFATKQHKAVEANAN